MPSGADACPACGSGAAEPPPAERIPGPVSRTRVERRWLGLPASLFLLCVGFAALGAAVALFVNGRWAWGLVLVGVAVLVLTGYVEAERRRPDDSPVLARGAAAASDGRSRALSAVEVWRTRLGSQVHRSRARTELERLERDRAPLLQQLGDAEWRGDDAAAREARARLEELDAERAAVERQLQERLAQAGERIREARLPVDQTMMVAPNQPNQPYPPPGEADPPQPATVPEPYPPPDEGTPPTPAPDPGPSTPDRDA